MAIAGVLLLAYLALFIYAGWLETSTPGGVAEDSPVLAAIGAGLLLLCAVNLISLVLAIIGMCLAGRRKVFAVLGTCLNGLLLISVTVLTIAAAMSD